MGGSAAAYCGHGWTGRLRFTTVPSYILHLNSLSFADLDCISFLSGMPLYILLFSCLVELFVIEFNDKNYHQTTKKR